MHTPIVNDTLRRPRPLVFRAPGRGAFGNVPELGMQRQCERASFTTSSNREYRFRPAVDYFEKYFDALDGLFVVATWSMVGLALAALEIWLGLGITP
jgi:hypothetical protein